MKIHISTFYKQPACISVLLLGLVVGQTAFAEPTQQEPEPLWQPVKVKVPPPPAWNTTRMVRIEMPVYSDVMVGVDIDSINVASKEGIVRYVALIQRRDGSLSAYYQGVYCKSYEGRTYARYHFDQSSPGWQAVDEPWQDLKKMNSLYVSAIAQSGACENSTSAYNTARARQLYSRNTKWRGTQYQGVAAPTLSSIEDSLTPVRP